MSALHRCGGRLLPALVMIVEDRWTPFVLTWRLRGCRCGDCGEEFVPSTVEADMRGQIAGVVWGATVGTRGTDGP